MDAAMKKKLEPLWRMASVVLAIATAGYVVAMKLNEYETRTEAREAQAASLAALERHSTDEETKREAMHRRILEAEEDLQEARIRDVRVEAQQRNVDDRLQILIELNRQARTASEREEQESRVGTLERAIEVRELAIERSIRRAGVSRSTDDPMAGLEGL